VITKAFPQFDISPALANTGLDGSTFEVAGGKLAKAVLPHPRKGMGGLADR
jgi:hypothetical protein